MGEPGRGKAWSAHTEHIGMRGERGELKHLSTLRKRKYSLSSGERKGKSLNRSCVKGYSRCMMGVESAARPTV